MRLEYLTDVEPEFCPMVRLYDFDPSQVELIRASVLKLANGSLDEVRVHELPFVIPLADCQLFFKVDNSDFGVREMETKGKLVCTLARTTWLKVAGYMESFLESREDYMNSFHWLDETFQSTDETSETSFLFSPHREGYW